MAETWRKETSGTWCTPRECGMEQDTGRMAGESPGVQDLVSPTRAPCLSSTDWFACHGALSAAFLPAEVGRLLLSASLSCSHPGWSCQHFDPPHIQRHRPAYAQQASPHLVSADPAPKVGAAAGIFPVSLLMAGVDPRLFPALSRGDSAQGSP